MPYIDDVYFYERSGRDQKNKAFGPHGLWYEQEGENYTKYDHPYSYSPFFLFGDHESIEGANCDYTDRYQLWDKERYDRAIKAMGKERRWDQHTPAEYNKFVKAYYGENYEVVGVVEWCNVSNGYPCWSIHFKENEGKKNG